jgi:gliding motility-associated-like protein
MKLRLLKIYFVLVSLGISLQSRAQVGFVTSNTYDTVCIFTTGLLTANGVVGSVSTWQQDVGITGIFNDIPSTTGDPTHSFFQIPNNVCYRFIHNNYADTSASICIIVQDSSIAGTISGGGPQCGIASGTLTVSGSLGTSLGWYSSTGGPFGSLGNTTTSQTYNVTGTTYFAYMTKNGVCPIDTTIDTISITPYSNGGTIANPATVCATSNSTTLTATGIVGTTVAWYSGPSATGPWTSLGTSTPSYTASNISTTTYYQVVAQNTNICQPDTSNTVAIAVNQPAVGGTLSGGTYHCGPPPATGSLTLTGNTGVPFPWEYSMDGGTTWVPSGCTGNSCAYSVPSPTATVIYRVTVDNGACPAVYVYDTISVRPNSVAGTASATVDSLCAGIGGGLLTLSGDTATSFHWEASVNGGTSWIQMPGGPTALYYNLPAGNYMVHCIVQSDQCPPATSNIVSIHVAPSPTVNIVNPDDSLQSGETFTIVANGTGNPTWTQGTVSSPNSFTTTATPYFSTDYVIVVDDGSGCIGTDTLHIWMDLGPFTGFIANTLTPNNDSINDAFWVENIEAYPLNSLEIFNEYGQSIYTASPYKNNWKGTYNGDRVPDGTYYYVLKVTDLNKEKKYKGFITILGGKP